jgi:hypothetical protein
MLVQEQLSLDFARRMPRKPYCSDNVSHEGLKIRGFENAIKHKYIQINPPGLQYWLVFDLDEGAQSWEDALLPPPNWQAFNPANGHSHVAYGIAAPVYKGSEARQKPLRLAAAIEEKYCESMRADRYYVGLITKNPTHHAWRVNWLTSHLYDLGELAEYVDLTGVGGFKKARPKLNKDSNGLFRNVQLFDALRYWAYDNVLAYRVSGSRSDKWFEAVKAKAAEFNNFPAPLPACEVGHTAKSVARWVWKHYTGRLTDEAFSARQAQRGKRRAAQRREGTSEAIRAAFAGLVEAGQRPTKKAVAEVVGISRQKLSEDYAGLWNELVMSCVTLAISDISRTDEAASVRVSP